MGALLRGIKREQVKRGQVIAAPGSIKAVKKFQAQIYVLTKDEGGRYTPFMEGYRPQLFLRTADVTVTLRFSEGTPDAAEKMVRWLLSSDGLIIITCHHLVYAR